jgi:hypothetical protein
MWSFMKSNPDVLVNTTQQGIQKVKNENFAFLLESTTNEYARQRDCDLIQVGDLLDSKSYGLGLTKNSEWTAEISKTILLLQEKGVVRHLYEKWWKQSGYVKNCDELEQGKSPLAQPMQFQSVRGVFFILVVGMSLAVLCALVENLVFKWKAATRKRQSYEQEN